MRPGALFSSRGGTPRLLGGGSLGPGVASRKPPAKSIRRTDAFINAVASRTHARAAVADGKLIFGVNTGGTTAAIIESIIP